MTGLLEFARGPALQIAVAIFVFGTVWRLVALFLLPKKVTPSRKREGASGHAVGAARGILSRFVPHKNFTRQSLFSVVNGYVFHLGLAIVVFGYAPHILYIDSLLGVSWPALPSPLIYVVGAITLGSLVAALIRRLANPVQRLISNADDYFSWAVTVAPVLTGLMAAGNVGGAYETILAIHILSFAVLLIWLPFGKLMHTFFFFISRGATGARMAWRGAKV